MAVIDFTEQRRAALADANAVRMQNAAWKRYIASLSYREGCEYVAALLEDDDEVAGQFGTLRVVVALNSITRFGDRVTTRALVRTGIPNGTKRIRDLVPAQRYRLATFLRSPFE